jgi:hypothetical protein
MCEHISGVMPPTPSPYTNACRHVNTFELVFMDPVMNPEFDLRLTCFTPPCRALHGWLPCGLASSTGTPSTLSSISLLGWQCRGGQVCGTHWIG